MATSTLKKIAPADIGAAEKQLCESPNSKWRLEIHNDGIIRVWRYDADIGDTGWNIAGVLLDENGTVPIWYGGTGATTPAGARANLYAMQNPDTNLTRHSAENVNDAPAGFSVWYGGCTNNPFSFHVSVLTIANIPEYIQQIAFPWDDNETRIAYRVRNGGTWHSWRYITMS